MERNQEMTLRTRMRERYAVARGLRARTNARLAGVLAALMTAMTAVATAQNPAEPPERDGERVEMLKNPSRLNESAPDTFHARFQTNKGVFVIEVRREWAPLAADRFYNLVKHGFYDDTRFFRVLEGFMVQFGLNGDPSVQSAWRMANLRDEPVRQSNLRGFVTFTRESAPHSRFTQVFISYRDNSYLDAEGFAPFGQVVEGMDVVDALYSGYGRANVPDQRRIMREGNEYLLRDYPQLDFITAATIEP
jgi:peptidyl-prolyl cis-trans isomerase A (cyclophilin A)